MTLSVLNAVRIGVKEIKMGYGNILPKGLKGPTKYPDINHCRRVILVLNEMGFGNYTMIREHMVGCATSLKCALLFLHSLGVVSFYRRGDIKLWYLNPNWLKMEGNKFI